MKMFPNILNKKPGGRAKLGELTMADKRETGSKFKARERRLAGLELVTVGRGPHCPWGREITRLKKCTSKWKN